MTCTWRMCGNDPEYVLIGHDRRVWAELCRDHWDDYQRALITRSRPVMLRAWTRAQGGTRMTYRKYRSGLLRYRAWLNTVERGVFPAKPGWF